MSNETSVHLTVIVFKGDPIDWQQYRHTALWFEFGNGSSSVLMHAVGPPQGFSLAVESRDPYKSKKFAKEIRLGNLRKPTTKAELVFHVSQTNINNSDPEWNCQGWVHDALERLMASDYLSPEEFHLGCDGMINATMEAEHEQYR